MANIENIIPHNFKKGQSGNPNGRPRGTENSKKRLWRLLQLTQQVKNPVTKEMEEFTVLEQMDMALIAKALKGDINAYKDILDRLGIENEEEERDLSEKVTLINLRDAIIPIHYDHFNNGYDWTISMGGSRCFEKNTLIKTDKGDIRISELAIGNKVLSFNHSTNEQEYKRVENVFENKENKKKCYKITFKNGEEIKCTFDHKIYHQGRYICAKDLVSLFKQLK